MARRVATLPSGVRITDHISLGVITKTFPRQVIAGVLERTGRASRRQRQLPAPVVMYYVIALGLYAEVSYGEVLRCLVEGLRWLSWPLGAVPVTGKSGISQARSRLGVEPVKQLYQQVVTPMARPETKGAWYGRWRLVSLDGSTLDVADVAANAAAFGRPGASRGRSGYPQLRFVCLVETGTHVLFGAELGAYASGEQTLAGAVVERLEPDMLCLADRGFFSFALWGRAAAGAALLWRVKKNQVLPCRRRLSDGSYLSTIHASAKDRRHDRQGRLVRVIEYRLEGIAGAEPLYRLITTMTDPAAAPARELAALYHERWEIENAFDELKTHLRGRRLVLRSKTPTLVEQEFYGFLLAHHAIRGLMHEAALKADVDPDEISFVHAVRVVRRKIPLYPAIPPSAADRLP
ncbi:MAG: IS4 family transposase [Alphaproteobacteria bacterium]|jgi:hypothetical protein|nr:IS4 family transposase [Alphaproteobacteria bacterium]